jgi:hypothetical protein
MSKQKKCIFVAGRDCPFKAPNIPFETCQVCIEAWKTETAISKKQSEGVQASTNAQHSISLPTVEDSRLASVNERFKEIDELLKNDEIEPLEYIRLRREYLNSLIMGHPSPDNKEKVPKPRAVRVAVITKSFFRKQIKTHPADWELPKKVSGKIIDMIFDMAEEKDARDIKLRSGGYKIACIAAEKNQLALMILEADEEFESYQDEMQRINLILRTEKMWQDALKKLE